MSLGFYQGELLRRIREFDPSIAVVIMTAYGTIEGAVEAVKLGATYYLTKPTTADQIVAAFERRDASVDVPVADARSLGVMVPVEDDRWMVTLVGWGLFSLSSTLAILLGAVGLAFALGLHMPVPAGFDAPLF